MHFRNMSAEMRKKSTPQGRDWRPLHALVFVVLMVALSSIPALNRWPLVWIAPLIAYGLVVALVPPLRSSFQRWRFGKPTRTGVLATLAITLGASSVLLAFQHFQQPDVHAYRDLLPMQLFGSAMAGGMVFSVTNALCEELVFRGVLHDSFSAQWGDMRAVLLSALLFGYCHMQGHPPGPIGAVLAGIYGLCLGWLRVHTRGLGLSFLAHIVADATIFLIVARGSGQP